MKEKVILTLPIKGIKLKKGNDIKFLLHGRDIDINLFIPAINKYLERNNNESLYGGACIEKSNSVLENTINSEIMIDPALVVGNVEKIYIGLSNGKLFATCKFISEEIENLYKKYLYLHAMCLVQVSKYFDEDIQDIKIVKFILCSEEIYKNNKGE